MIVCYNALCFSNFDSELKLQSYTHMHLLVFTIPLVPPTSKHTNIAKRQFAVQQPMFLSDINTTPKGRVTCPATSQQLYTVCQQSLSQLKTEGKNSGLFVFVNHSTGRVMSTILQNLSQNSFTMYIVLKMFYILSFSDIVTTQTSCFQLSNIHQRPLCTVQSICMLLYMCLKCCKKYRDRSCYAYSLPAKDVRRIW